MSAPARPALLSPAVGRAALAVLCVLWLAQVVNALVDLPLSDATLNTIFVKWLYNIVLVGGGVSCLVRGYTRSNESTAWYLMGCAILAWASGNLYYVLAFNAGDEWPFPSWADLGWTMFYPFCYVGLVLLLRSRISGFRTSSWLDGFIGALSLAAVGTALVVPVVRDSISDSGDTLYVMTTLAYPLLDLLLVALVVGALAMTGWKPGRSWTFLIVGLGLFLVADTIYVYQGNAGTYVAGSIFDTGWPGAALVLGFAAWQPARRVRAELNGARVMAMPIIFALVALGILVHGGIKGVDPVAIVLAAVSLLVVIVRMGMTFRENSAMLSHSREESVTDALTGLGNRRRLLNDLEDKIHGGHSGRYLLVLFDLDGFKSYNDSFGHLAGDDLLNRLGRHLKESSATHGSAYRLGGDEFCVLADVGSEHPEPLIAQWSLALSERGEGFEIGASYGWMELAEDLGSASDAIRLADQRMYANKRARKGTLARGEAIETSDAPGLVQRLAGAVAAEMGLGPERSDEVVAVAELHDIGKRAIPTAILNKRGSLDEAEMNFVQRHTVVGERLLAAVPGYERFSSLVRATQERYDGAGFPDGLADVEIPLAARIVAVCDAFHAVSVRSSADAALAELTRCAGSQFDPQVVQAFSATWTKIRDDITPIETIAAETSAAVGTPDPAAPSMLRAEIRRGSNPGRHRKTS